MGWGVTHFLKQYQQSRGLKEPKEQSRYTGRGSDGGTPRAEAGGLREASPEGPWEGATNTTGGGTKAGHGKSKASERRTCVRAAGEGEKEYSEGRKGAQGWRCREGDWEEGAGP